MKKKLFCLLCALMLLVLQIPALSPVLAEEDEDFDVEEEEWFDDEDSWEKESLNDAMWFGQWLYGINELVDFATGGWHSSDEIRIVCYLS